MQALCIGSLMNCYATAESSLIITPRHDPHLCDLHLEHAIEAEFIIGLAVVHVPRCHIRRHIKSDLCIPQLNQRCDGWSRYDHAMHASGLPTRVLGSKAQDCKSRKEHRRTPSCSRSSLSSSSSFDCRRRKGDGFGVGRTRRKTLMWLPLSALSILARYTLQGL